ncbi:hypothetical protein L873DRAFT_1787405 [Choiromyces venosus 120613-1]|uniref:Uncharacterized protein n=1 Tax=Choiromyces venosus 120613-1 TaxID=1336337 RepID=A0A3N4JX91_9PEZI|nr:hypothetical protein L873DRAFT_1787405 [Choiromyces venosus 120613-1]
MSDRNYSGEDYSDLSGDTLTEFSLQEGGDTCSRALSPCESLSNNLTPPTHGVHSDESAVLVSTERSGGRDATAEVVKGSASGAEVSFEGPLVEVKREFIKTSASLEIDEDMLLLPDFSTGLVGKTKTQNGCHELSLIDLMSPEEVNCLGYKFNALIPTQSPKKGSGITNSVSVLIMNNSKVVDGEPKLKFEDSFDCLNDLCDVAALEPKGLSTYLIPGVLGSCVQEKAYTSLKNICHQTSLMDSCIVEGDQLMDGVEQQMILSTSPSDETWGFTQQVPALPTKEEAERIERNKSVFAWIDAVVISAGHITEGITTASTVTNDLIDLFDTGSLLAKSSPRISPLALAHQHPAHSLSGISILDLHCDYAGPPVSRGLKNTTITTSLNSTPTGDLLLMDLDNSALDSANGGGPNPCFPCIIESPPSHNLALSGTLTTTIPPQLRGASEYPPIQKEVERMHTVVKVVISVPKEAKEERKEASSLISGPIISARTASLAEVGNAAWTRWVEANAEKDSVASPTSSPPRQNPRSEKPRGGIPTVPKSAGGGVNPKRSKWVTVGLNKGGHAGVNHVKNMARSSSGNNNSTASNGTNGSSQVKLTVGQTHRHPIRAVSSPAGAPSLAQRAITLAPPEVTPVTWSGSGLPFEGLASRRGMDVPLGAMGYHNPKRVSYKRTSTYNREEKVREQLRGTRRVAPPRPKVSPPTPVKQNSWESQEADFLRASGPADPCALLNSSWIR